MLCLCVCIYVRYYRVRYYTVMLRDGVCEWLALYVAPHVSSQFICTHTHIHTVQYFLTVPI